MATELELIGIELELRGEEEVFKDLQKLDDMLRGFSGAKGKREIQIEIGKAKQKLLELKGEINEVQEAMQGTKHGSDEYKELSKQLKELRSRYRDVTQGINEMNLALKRGPKTWGQYYKSISTGLKHIGQNAQTLGNALTKIGSPFRSITQGALYGTGYKLLNMATEGLSSGFARADVMKKYELIMADYEKINFSAAKSKEILDESVQGLPTALDEIMSIAQRFTATTGDIEKGTKAAIAVNNAFLASMSTDTQRYQGMMQLQDVLGGKKMNAREWQSLANSMMPAIRKIGETLGYEGKELDEYVAKVQQGKIANQDFLDALIKAGYGKNSTLGQIAEYSKQTWEALASNTKIAFARMGEGIITALDDVSMQYNGKGLIANLFDAKGVIDQWKDSITAWIRANPDTIINFFNQLKEIDIASFGRGMLDGMKLMAKGIEFITGALGDKSLQRIGRFMVIAGPLGRVITLFGGLMKGLSHPLAALFATLIKLSGMTGGELGKRFSSGGLIGMIKSLFGGKNAERTIANAPKMATTLNSVFRSLQGVLTGAGMVAIPALTAFGTIKALKSVIKDLGEIGELVGEVDWANAAKAVGAFSAFIGSFAALSYVLGDAAKLSGSTAGLTTLKTEAILGAITTLASGILALDMRLIKDAFKSFKDITESLSDGVDNLNGLKTIETSSVTSRIKNTIDAMRQVYSSLKEDENGNSFVSSSPSELKAMKETLENMSGVLMNVGSISDSMAELSSKGIIDSETSVDVGKKVGGIFEGLGEAYASYVGTNFGYNPQDATKGMAEAIKGVNEALQGIIGEDGLLMNMRRVLNQTRDIPGVQTISSVMSSVVSWLAGDNGLFSNLMEITKQSNRLTAANSFATKMDNFANAFESIRIIFRKLKRIKSIQGAENDNNGEIGGLRSVKSLLNQLEGAFNADRVDRINSQVQAFVKELNGLFDAIDEINKRDGNITIEINLKDRIVGKDKVLSDIAMLAIQIQAALNKIPNYYSKTVNVDVVGNAKFRQSGNGWVRGEYNGSDVSRQLGGLVYRAKGGSIFKPRGTDTVPAMLTPGEFVQRKAATDFFGLDFMNKINALDVRGAMNALMNRGISSTNIGRQNVYNSTVNNNQRVNMTVHSNNPDSIKVRMGRFAGAF